MFGRRIHHAYLVPHDPLEIVSLLETAIEKELSFTTVGNPDFLKMIRDHASVDDVRELQVFQEHRPLKERKVALFGFDRITVEAQNKLLKTLEEPRGDTVIFLITANGHTLLDTVHSRLETLKGLEPSSHDDLARMADVFLAAPHAKRLTLLEKEGVIENRASARRFLDEVERLLSKYGVAADHPTELKRFYEVRGYLADRGSSVKNLLEYVALSLPRVAERNNKKQAPKNK